MPKVLRTATILPLFAGVAAIACAGAASLPTDPQLVPTPRALPMPVGGSGKPYLSVDLAARGYAETEYLLKGQARVLEWSADRVAAARGGPVPYATRLLVRRPADPRRFSGLVVVELLNPTSLRDTSPVWNAAQEELVRAGHAWVGVTVKPVALAALRGADAARYGAVSFALKQPPECQPAMPLPGVPGSDGDALASPSSENGLAWDVIAQAGALLRSGSRENPLGDLQPRRIVATGLGEAADDLVTYVNVNHAGLRLGDGSPVFDGYVAVGAGLTDAPINQCAAPLPREDARRRIGPRDAPFIEVATGSELMRTLHLRRDDSDDPKDFFRRYEVAGASLAPPSDGAENRCEEPPGELPLGWALDGVFANLAQLLFQGTPPPRAAPLAIDPAGDLARDGFGNAVGGLRLPQVQVPLASYAPHSTPHRADDPASVWRCSLTGTMRRFDSAEMKRLYGTRAEYLRRFDAAVDEAVQARIVTPADAASMKAALQRTAPSF